MHIKFHFCNSAVWKGLIFLFLGTLLSHQSIAQTGVGAYTLPSLDTVIQHCLLHSPALKFKDAEIRKQYYTLKSEKRNWTQIITANLSAGTGNQRFIIPKSDGSFDVLNSLNNNYVVGIGIRLPLSEISNRQNLINISKSEYEMSVLQKEMVKQELMEKVIELYYELNATIKLLAIQSNIRQTFQMEKALAEKGFKAGNLEMTQWSSIIQAAASAEANYEVVQKQFNIQLKQLESLVGQKLSALP